MQGKDKGFWIGYIRGRMAKCAVLSPDFGSFSKKVLKELRPFRIRDIQEALSTDGDFETFYFNFKEGLWRARAMMR